MKKLFLDQKNHQNIDASKHGNKFKKLEDSLCTRDQKLQEQIKGILDKLNSLNLTSESNHDSKSAIKKGNKKKNLDSQNSSSL